MIRVPRAREGLADEDLADEDLVDEPPRSGLCISRRPTIRAMSRTPRRRKPAPSRARERPIAPPGRPAACIVEHIDDEDTGTVYQREYVRCSSTGCWCREQYPEGGHGPYWYAYYLDRAGRWRSVYIGKEFRKL